MDLEGYEGFERIGRGGFATVYRARQIRLDRLVAVKVLAAEFDEPGDARRFEAEARALGRLSRHRNVVDVYDAGVSPEGRAFLVMRLYSRGTLADQLRRTGPLPVADIVSIGAQLAAALHTAHDLGVVHRDVKPENVLLDDDGSPALADFGIAAIMDPTGRITSSSAFSVAHAAPEVLDRDEFSPASDQYSLASSLYALATGGSPFACDSVSRQVLAVLHDPVPPLARPDIPAAVAAVVMRGLAKNPTDRYPDTGTFGAALQHAWHTGNAAHPPPPAQPATPLDTDPQGPPHQAPSMGNPASATVISRPTTHNTDPTDTPHRNGSGSPSDPGRVTPVVYPAPQPVDRPSTRSHHPTDTRSHTIRNSIIAACLITLALSGLGLILATGLPTDTKEQPAADGSTSAEPTMAPSPDGAGASLDPGGSTPFPSTAPDGRVAWTPPPQGFKECGEDTWANDVTSCPFAMAVSQAWRASGGSALLEDVYSPVTQRSYAMACSSDVGWVQCTGGNNAVVLIWAPNGATPNR